MNPLFEPPSVFGNHSLFLRQEGDGDSAFESTSRKVEG